MARWCLIVLHMLQRTISHWIAQLPPCTEPIAQISRKVGKYNSWDTDSKVVSQIANFPGPRWGPRWHHIPCYQGYHILADWVQCEALGYTDIERNIYQHKQNKYTRKEFCEQLQLIGCAIGYIRVTRKSTYFTTIYMRHRKSRTTPMRGDRIMKYQI